MNYFIRIPDWSKFKKLDIFCFNGKIPSLKSVIKKIAINAIDPNPGANPLKRSRKLDDGSMDSNI